MTTIPHTQARLVWIPKQFCGRSDRFAVVSKRPGDHSVEHDAMAAAWGGHVWWLGPGSNDVTFEDLHGAAYVNKLQEIFVELVTEQGLDPRVVRREFEKI